MQFSKILAVFAAAGTAVAQFSPGTWAVIILNDAPYVDDATVVKRGVPANNIIYGRSLEEGRKIVAAREAIDPTDVIVAKSVDEAKAIHDAHTSGNDANAILASVYLLRLAMAKA